MSAYLADQQMVGAAMNSSLINAFAQALERATTWKVSPERQYELEFAGLDGRQRLDALLQVLGPAGGLHLAVEITRQGYPRDIKNALWQLDEYCRVAQSSTPLMRLVLGQHLSPGAREVLRSRGVAYYDEAGGSLFLRHGEVIIDIDRPAEPAPRSRPASLFSGAREQVVHALLHSRGKPVTGRQLGEQANTSGFTVSQTLRELERFEWVEAGGAGRTAVRRLVQPGKLLDAWAQAWTTREEASSRWFAFAPNARTVLDTIGVKLRAAQLTDWAITGATAGNEMSPLLTGSDVLELIIPPGYSGRIAEAAGATRVDKGANLVLRERSGAANLFRTTSSASPAQLASPWVVYLDLLRDDRGRHKELAQQLRTTVLKV